MPQSARATLRLDDRRRRRTTRTAGAGRSGRCVRDPAAGRGLTVERTPFPRPSPYAGRRSARNGASNPAPRGSTDLPPATKTAGAAARISSLIGTRVSPDAGETDWGGRPPATSARRGAYKRSATPSNDAASAGAGSYPIRKTRNHLPRQTTWASSRCVLKQMYPRCGGGARGDGGVSLTSSSRDGRLSSVAAGGSSAWAAG